MNEADYEIQTFTGIGKPILMRIVETKTRILLAIGEGDSYIQLKQKLLKEIEDSKTEFAEGMK